MARATMFDNPTGLARARDLVPGASFIKKFGVNPNITNVTETIWDKGGLYVPPVAARLHDVKSTDIVDAGTVITSGTVDTDGSNQVLIDTSKDFTSFPVNVGDAVLNDTNMQIGFVTSVAATTLGIASTMRSPNTGLDGMPNEAGDSYRIVRDASTGASICHIAGLNAFFLEQEEFVVLNGQTDVETAFTWVRQHRMRIFTTSTAGAVGTITSTEPIAGTVTAQIIDGNNQTLMAVYTVPANKIGYIRYWKYSLTGSVSSDVIVELKVGQLLRVGLTTDTQSIRAAGSSNVAETSDDYIIIPGGADVWMQANASNPNTGVSGRFDVVMYKK